MESCKPEALDAGLRPCYLDPALAISPMIAAISRGRDHIGQWLVGRSTHVTLRSSGMPARNAHSGCSFAYVWYCSAVNPVQTNVLGTFTLLEAARVEQDVAKRIEMYQQAEQIIVDDAAALFTTQYLSYELVKPYVKGYVSTPIDIPIERYMWLEGK